MKTIYLSALSVCLLICFTAAPTSAAPHIVVPAKAVWKYLGDGTDLGTAWPHPAFDDSSWPSGAAQLGYGDGDEATLVATASPRPPTVYFRRTVILPTAVSNATLRLLRDDGAVVYINGVEVLRNNMPSGPVAFNTLATVSVGGEEETSVFINAVIPSDAFVTGLNVIAVEVHQNNVASSDMSFALELSVDSDPPPPEQTIVSVTAVDSEASEPGILAVVDGGQFAFRREGNLHAAIPVRFTLRGTALNGVDYRYVTNEVVILAGATQAVVHIHALMDNLVEGTETVVLTIEPLICIAIFPPPPECYVIESGSATVFIHDGPGSGNHPPIVEITKPTNGTIFPRPANIHIEAFTRDVDGYANRIEFFANNQKIGEAEIVFIQPPPPGEPIFFDFTWTNPPPGQYVLRASAVDDGGALGTSAPVIITVMGGTNPPPTNGIVIRFEPPSLPGGSRLISNWVESGFFFWTPNRLAHTDSGVSAAVPDNGGAYLQFGFNHTPLTISHLAGESFRLLSVDLAEYSTVFPVPKEITFTGHRSDGSTVSTVFRTDGVIDGTGPVADFETFMFGAEFSGLVRVEVSPPAYSLDNLHVAFDSNPPPPERTVINVVATDPQAEEPGLTANPAINSGAFTFYRTGNLDTEVTVLFSLGGSASNGVDYIRITNQIAIPPQATQALVHVFPRFDNVAEGTEAVVLTLETPACPAIFPPPPECYSVGPSSQATVFISDWPALTNRPPEVVIVTPHNGDSFPAGTGIFLSANVFTDDAGVQRVDFYRGSTLIGQAIGPLPGPSGGWGLSWSNPPVGNHVLHAVATDTTGLRGTSAPVSITVTGVGETNFPIVRVFAEDGNAAEGAVTPGTALGTGRFTFTRTGGSLANPLPVYFVISGTALNGVDYVFVTNRLIIPPGASNANVFIVPTDDAQPEPTETVVVRILSPPTLPASRPYHVGSPSTATVFVHDNDSPGSNEPPVVALHFPQDGEVFTAPANIHLKAAAQDPEDGFQIRVEFFAGTNRLGMGTFLPTLCPAPWCPSFDLTWSNVPPGDYALTAIARDSAGAMGVSAPVHVTVVGDPIPILVRIEATGRIAEESSEPFRRLNMVGEFTISHTGPTNEPVSVFVRYSGSATPGVDYPSLPWIVTIPAGSDSTKIRVEPDSDRIPEGIETLVATLSDCPPDTDPPLGMPCFITPIDPAHDRATVFIRDDGITEASLAITRPTDGTSFRAGETILIEATAIDLEGYISRVEFWAGEQQIGVSEIFFIRPPDPGTPVHHSFEWQGAAPGTHVLTARAARADGTALQSQPVNTYLGVAGHDSDRDGVPDEDDQCPNTPGGSSVDAHGCSADQRDSDHDGVADSRDQCPSTPPSEPVDEQGCSNGPPAATDLTFDDVSPFEYVLIQNGYGGLQWSNFFIQNGSNSPGFFRGAVSPPNVAFNGLGNPATISSESLFTLKSAYLTAVYVAAQQINVQGFTRGILTYNNTYSVNDEAPTLIHFNYAEVDRVRFTITTSPGGIFAMDNLAVAWVRDTDSDHDGVPNNEDDCPNTPAGVVVNEEGCSLAQIAPCNGRWRNHGEYVDAIATAAFDFYDGGLITQIDLLAIMRDAVHSDCGRRQPRLGMPPQCADDIRTNGCRLILEGDGPVTCIVESSGDLIQWRPISTNTLSGAAIHISDPEACTAPRRFYRVRSP